MSIVGKRLDGSRWHLAGRYSGSPDHTVLDGEPVPPPQKGQKGTEPYPSQMCGLCVAERLDVDQDATWYN